MSAHPDGTATAAQRWHGVTRLLAVRLDNLGDVLMTTPALAALRQRWPAAHLTLLASQAGAAVAAHLPMVDDVIACDAAWLRHERQPVQGQVAQALGRAELELVQRLAAERFDAAVIFTVCTQSALPAALICRMAGIGLRLAHSRENPYDLLTDWVAETDHIAPGMRHEVARQLALVAAVGCQVPDQRLRFHVLDQDAARSREQLALRGLAPGTPYFVVHCGASAPSRRYPAVRFGAAADLIAQRSGSVPVFTGSADEAQHIDAARRCMTQASICVTGRLGLGELASVIGGAQVLVANNTGPVHIAAALGTPVVDLYALTNPQHTPWQVSARVLNHDVPCRNCLKSRCPQGHHDCLRRVEPTAVSDAALELMAGRNAGTPGRQASAPAH